MILLYLFGFQFIDGDWSQLLAFADSTGSKVHFYQWILIWHHILTVHVIILSLKVYTDGETSPGFEELS